LTAEHVLALLRRDQFQVAVREGKLFITPGLYELTDSDRALVRQFKPELINLLEKRKNEHL
jgi:hypothetical protein